VTKHSALRIAEDDVDHVIFFALNGNGAGACKLANARLCATCIMKFHPGRKGSDNQAGGLQCKDFPFLAIHFLFVFINDLKADRFEAGG
jgi:hypothetical protein